MKRALLAATILASALTGASAQDRQLQDRQLMVAVQNMTPYLDPGRDHSNVGSQHYYNSFDTLIEKDHTKAESVWKPGLATAWKQTSPTQMERTHPAGAAL